MKDLLSCVAGAAFAVAATNPSLTGLFGLCVLAVFGRVVVGLVEAGFA